MLQTLKISVTSFVFLLALVPILTLAQGSNTVLTTLSPLPGGGTGVDNVVVGPGNLYPVASNAYDNVFVGKDAGIATTTSTANSFVGKGSGFSNTTGSYNSFIGFGAGYSNATGTGNSFLGALAGYDNTTGEFNSFVGMYAGFDNTTGSYNSIVGYQAGFKNTTGVQNSILGYQAGLTNTTGRYNSFVGYQAGRQNTTANYNSFFGYTTGYENTTGTFNSFFGGTAGRYNTTGSENTFVGFQAGFNNTTGSSNSFLGRSSGQYNSTASNNSFFGYQAGQNNTTTDGNTYMGAFAGKENTAGYSTTFVGISAGHKNTTGHYNAFLGAYSGTNNTTGYTNAFFGAYAGQSNSTGYSNTFLGYAVDGTGPNASSLKRSTALGYRAKVGVNDGLVLGDTTNVKVGIGTAYPNERLTLRGNMNFVAYDNSLRLKNQPFLHFNEHESLALGLGSEIPSGAEGTLVLGSETTQVLVPSGAEGSSGLVLSQYAGQPNIGQVLTVNGYGKVILTQPRIQVPSTSDWADKVFEENYPLRPLSEVEDFIKKHKHLPGIPSAEKMVTEGMESAAFNAKLLEKIEELTLYVVMMEKRLKKLEKQ